MADKTETQKTGQSVWDTVKAVSIGATCEVGAWHTIDTAKLRWMALTGDNARVRYPSEFATYSAFRDHYRKIIFLDAWDKSAVAKFRSLTNGMLTALVYRVYQRLIVNTSGLYIAPQLTEKSYSALPEEYRTTLAKSSLTIGFSALVGLAEAVVVHPVDTIKNKKQVANAGSAWHIISSERFGLWRAWEAAAARNMLGASLHWSTFAALKGHLLKDDPKRKLTAFEATFISAAAVSASIIGTNPLNLAKLRVQTAKSLGHAETTVKAELLDVFTKRTFMHGVIPNLLSSVPRKASSLALTVILMEWLSGLAAKEQVATPELTRIEPVEPAPACDDVAESVYDDPVFDPWDGHGGRYSFFGTSRSMKPSGRVIEHDETQRPGL